MILIIKIVELLSIVTGFLGACRDSGTAEISHKCSTCSGLHTDEPMESGHQSKKTSQTVLDHHVKFVPVLKHTSIFDASTNARHNSFQIYNCWVMVKRNVHSINISALIGLLVSKKESYLGTLGGTKIGIICISSNYCNSFVDIIDGG